MACPAVTGLGVALFVICRSALVFTGVVVVLVLLLGVGSGVVLVMVAVFTKFPSAFADTVPVMRTLPPAPTFNVAIVTVQLLALPVATPALAVQPVNVTPVGALSAIVTFEAVLGPAFVNNNV